MRRTWRALAMPLMLAALIYPATLLGWIPPGSEAAPAGSTEDDLRMLAERLINGAGPYGPSSSVALLPGQVPSSMPLPLPVPPGGRVIGSAIRSDGSRQQAIDVVIDAPGRPSEVMAFLRREMQRLGWSAATYGPGGPSGGFRPTGTAEGGAFCASGATQWLSAYVSPRANAPSDLRVRLELQNQGPCVAPTPPQPVPAGGGLPPLDAPDGTVVQMGYGGPRMQSDAIAESSMTPAQLEGHFGGQLQAAGWARQGGGDGGSFAWSTWRPAGQSDAVALLYVLDLPGTNRRGLHLTVDGPGAPGPGPRPAAPPYPAYPLPPPGPLGPPPTPTPALAPR
jgi:hypothetical protein